MNTNDLKIFEAVAANASFTRAAELMHTVQSNVTARIRALEEEFGAPLFERTSKRVRLTSEGEKLLPYARRIDELLGEAKTAVAGETSVKGVLRIGSLETTAALRLPEIIADYCASCPDVELRLSTRTTGELIADVLDYRIDGAFVAGPVTSELLAQQFVVQEELVLATPRAMRTIDDVTGHGERLKVVVFRKSCSYRQRLEALLGTLGIMNYSVMEFGSLEGIIRFVESGIGVTLLPKGVMKLYGDRKEIRTHTLPREIALVNTLFIRREDMPVPRRLALFMEEATRQRWKRPAR